MKKIENKKSLITTLLITSSNKLNFLSIIINLSVYYFAIMFNKFSNFFFGNVIKMLNMK